MPAVIIPNMNSLTPNTPIQLQVGVKALLKNKEGKFLLLRRSLTKYPEVKGRFDIVGGRIEPGTPLTENLAREIKEETNLTLIGEPELVAAQDILRVPGRHIVRLTYVAEVEGAVRLDTEENDAFEWFSARELVKKNDVDMYFKELLDRGIFKNK